MKQVIDVIFKILNYGLIFAGGINVISAIMFFMGMVDVDGLKQVNASTQSMNIYQLITLLIGMLYIIMATYNIKLVHQTKKTIIGVISGVLAVVLVVINQCIVINYWTDIQQVLQGIILVIICTIGSFWYYYNYAK